MKPLILTLSVVALILLTLLLTVGVDGIRSTAAQEAEKKSRLFVDTSGSGPRQGPYLANGWQKVRVTQTLVDDMDLGLSEQNLAAILAGWLDENLYLMPADDPVGEVRWTLNLHPLPSDGTESSIHVPEFLRNKEHLEWKLCEHHIPMNEPFPDGMEVMRLSSEMKDGVHEFDIRIPISKTIIADSFWINVPVNWPDRGEASFFSLTPLPEQVVEGRKIVTEDLRNLNIQVKDKNSGGTKCVTIVMPRFYGTDEDGVLMIAGNDQLNGTKRMGEDRSRFLELFQKMQWRLSFFHELGVIYREIKIHQDHNGEWTIDPITPFDETKKVAVNFVNALGSPLIMDLSKEFTSRILFNHEGPDLSHAEVFREEPEAIGTQCFALLPRRAWKGDIWLNYEDELWLRAEETRDSKGDLSALTFMSRYPPRWSINTRLYGGSKGRRSVILPFNDQLERETMLRSLRTLKPKELKEAGYAYLSLELPHTVVTEEKRYHVEGAGAFALTYGGDFAPQWSEVHHGQPAAHFVPGESWSDLGMKQLDLDQCRDAHLLVLTDADGKVITHLTPPQDEDHAFAYDPFRGLSLTCLDAEMRPFRAITLNKAPAWEEIEVGESAPAPKVKAYLALGGTKNKSRVHGGVEAYVDKDWQQAGTFRFMGTDYPLNLKSYPNDPLRAKIEVAPKTPLKVKLGEFNPQRWNISFINEDWLMSYKFMEDGEFLFLPNGTWQMVVNSHPINGLWTGYQDIWFSETIHRTNETDPLVLDLTGLVKTELDFRSFGASSSLRTSEFDYSAVIVPRNLYAFDSVYDYKSMVWTGKGTYYTRPGEYIVAICAEKKVLNNGVVISTTMRVEPGEVFHFTPFAEGISREDRYALIPPAWQTGMVHYSNPVAAGPGVHDSHCQFSVVHGEMELMTKTLRSTEYGVLWRSTWGLEPYLAFDTGKDDPGPWTPALFVEQLNIRPGYRLMIEHEGRLYPVAVDALPSGVCTFVVVKTFTGEEVFRRTSSVHTLSSSALQPGHSRGIHDRKLIADLIGAELIVLPQPED